LPKFVPRIFAVTVFENILILHGAKAGRGQNRDQIDRLCGLLGSCGLKSLATDDLSLAKKTIQSEQRTLVVAAGGDGTLSLAADLAQNHNAAIVPLPLGTENLLARHFGHRCDAEHLLRSIHEGRVVDMDSMWIERGQSTLRRSRTMRSLIMATIGFDADVVRRMHLTRQGHIRRTSYISRILGAMCRYRFPTLSARLELPGGDLQTIQCGWLMAFNLPRYAASLAIQPDADPTDGLLDVVAFDHGSILSGIKYFAGVVTRTHLKFSDVHSYQVRSVEIRSLQAGGVLQCDGDYVGKIPVRIQCQPKTVPLLMPAGGPR
jgi:diacylglycerol kinase (ATP)